MARPFDNIPKPMGLYSSDPPQGMAASDWIAVALCGVWFLGAVVFFMFMDGAVLFETEQGKGMQFVMVLLATFFPMAVILMVASAARSVRLIREESQRLQSAVDSMRQSFEEESRTRKTGLQPSVEKKLEEIAAAARQTETVLATFTSSRQTAAPAPAVPVAEAETSDQPALALGIEADSPPSDLSKEDLIVALNFPETAEDKAGFAALRRALKDREAAQVIQASQDILTHLSEDGIYMDDLRHDRTRPELWRRFAGGERGAMMTALGGVRDRSSLALTAGRMRQDTVFRDTAHHFLRRFDKMLQSFSAEATDGELAAFTNTRSAKAFMLLGRVSGIFD